MLEPAQLYGLIAEFKSAEALLDAARHTYAAGYRKIDAYSPFNIEGLSDAIGFKRDRVPLVFLLGGIIGGIGIYFLQWYSAVVNFPFMIGGRPYHSWPSFIPPTFEMTVLGAALAGFFGMFMLNGLPKLYHPVFNARHFDLASRNRFFLLIEAADPHFDRHQTEAFLQSLQPLLVEEVSK